MSSAPGVLAYVSPQAKRLDGYFYRRPQANGSLQWSTNGAFTYTPGFGFVGQDSFQYQAQAGSLTSNVATIFVTVVAGLARVTEATKAASRHPLLQLRTPAPEH